MSRRVTLLFNSDHESSEESEETSAALGAQAMASALERAGHHATLLDIASEDLPRLREHVRRERPDLIFNLVESLACDTRRHPWVADALDGLGVPYTGSSGPVLSRCLFKHRAKRALTRAGIRTPEGCLVRQGERLPELALPLPAFVKLSHEDASIGITEANVAGDLEALRARVHELMATYRQDVLIERFVEGREVNVAILGTGDAALVLPLHEIDFSKLPPERPRIVSYAAKWEPAHVDYLGTRAVPLRGVPERTRAAIRRTALAAYRTLGLRDYGRVDMRVDKTGTPWVIDVNPNCDLSEDAGFARAARAARMDHPSLLQRVCELALERTRPDTLERRPTALPSPARSGRPVR